MRERDLTIRVPEDLSELYGSGATFMAEEIKLQIKYKNNEI